MRTAISDVPELQEYISYIKDKKNTARVCNDQRQLVSYLEKVFATEDLYVDQDQLQRYMNLQRHFSYRLFPWERFVFTLHNCTYRQDGRLRFPRLFCYLGRGSGKNGYVSFESFCLLTPVNGVRDYHVDIFSNSEEQSKTSFLDVHGILESDKDRYKQSFRWNLEEIKNLKTGSKLKYRTSGYKSKDGGRPGCVIFDEYHMYESYQLLGIARTGLGKKKYSRETIITTDGTVRGGPLDDLLETSHQILRGIIPDGGLLPFLCHLDDKSEIDDEENWYKANPSLQFFPDLLDQLRSEYIDYKRDPYSNSDFATRRMNLPLTMELKSVADWEDILACNGDLPDLTGHACIGCIDYANSRDFVSAGLLFKEGSRYYYMQHTWIYRGSQDLPKIEAPLQQWSDLGYITWVPEADKTISPQLPAQWLQEMGQRYDIRSISVDYYRLILLADALKNAGFDTDPHGANNIRLTKRVTQARWAPEILDAFDTHRICWGEDPMMAWYTYNACLITAQNGNLAFGKKDKERRKTDGFSALVSGICASMDLPEESAESIEDITIFNF